MLEKTEEVLPPKYAESVPRDAERFVQINAAVQIGGGALLAAGKAPRLAALALAGTLATTNLGAHAFWNETDPHRKAQERKDFLTGLSLLGGLIIASVDTEGKPSLTWRGRRAARRASDAVSAALPLGSSTLASNPIISDNTIDQLSHGLHIAAEKGHVLADVARERGLEFADIARERGPELADRVSDAVRTRINR